MISTFSRVVVSLVCVTIAMLALEHSAWIPRVSAQSAVPGGLLEGASSSVTRARLSASEIAAFMPARGVFTFPAPYSTQGIRLTNSSDCAGGGDCINPVGYSYWRNINNHAGSNTMYIFLGTNLNAGGVGPILLSYDKTTGTTRNLGPMFSSTDPYSYSTAEGWYFSAT